MAENTNFELSIVTPEKTLFKESSYMAIIPGTEGDFGVLAGHIPFVSTIRPGFITIYDKEDSIYKSLFIAGGLAEVNQESCVILADEAIAIEDLSKDYVRKRLNDAKSALENSEDQTNIFLIKELEIAEAMENVIRLKL